MCSWRVLEAEPLFRSGDLSGDTYQKLSRGAHKDVLVVCSGNTALAPIRRLFR